MNHQLFPFSQVPKDWTLCFLSECPLKENCQRWLAYSYAPDDVRVRSCVMPQALRSGRCHYYVEPQPVRMASGFRNIFRSVRREDYPSMLGALFNYLGSRRTFYRYRSGEKLLSPEQQSWMKNLFKKYGYKDDAVQFDKFIDTYQFPVAH